MCKNTKCMRCESSLQYLDAMLVEEAGHGEASLLVQGLTEDDNLLEEEDSPLLHPGQETSVRVGHQEGVLQEEPALGYNLPLWRREKETGWGG